MCLSEGKRVENIGSAYWMSAFFKEHMEGGVFSAGGRMSFLLVKLGALEVLVDPQLKHGLKSQRPPGCLVQSCVA